MYVNVALFKVVCDSGSTLVIALHHPEAEYRKLALKKVSDILKEPIVRIFDEIFNVTIR
jgi:hypothetical protein